MNVCKLCPRLSIDKSDKPDNGVFIVAAQCMAAQGGEGGERQCACPSHPVMQWDGAFIHPPTIKLAINTQQIR